MYVPGGGSSGPFDHYEASAYAVRSSGDELHGTVSAILDDLADGTADAAANGTAAVDGLLRALMTSAPDPMLTEVRDLSAAAVFCGGAVRTFADAIDEFNTGVDGLNSRYNAAVATDFGVADASHPGDSTAAEREEADSERTGEVDAARQQLMRELSADFARLEQALDDEATGVAGMLRRGPNESDVLAMYATGNLPYAAPVAFTGVDFSGATLSNLPTDLQQMSDEELAQWLIDHPDVGPGLAINLDESQQQAVAQHLVDRANAIGDDSSPEELGDLDGLLTTWQGSLGVTEDFYELMGPSSLLELYDDIGIIVYSDSDGLQPGQGLAGTLQRGLELSTAMWTSTQARDYARSLVASIDDGELGEDRALALSYLLHDGHYSDGFLEGAGDGLDAYERLNEDFPDGGWRMRSSGPSGLSWLFTEDDVEAAFDPMASYMSALGNNGSASLDFFSDDEHGADRQRYYLLERLWGHDDFEGITAAVDSATTDFGSFSDVEDRQDAAGLVSSAVEYLTNRDNNDWVEFGGNDEEFQPGDLSGEASRSLAHMLGAYMPAVDYYASAPDAAGDQAGDYANVVRSDLGTLEDMPVFEDAELRRMLEVTLSNDDGFIAMREATSNYQNAHLADVLSHRDETGFYDGPNGTDGIWQTATNADARLEGIMMDSIGEVEIAEGVERDEQIKAWIDLGSGLASAVPVPGGGLVDGLADQTLGLGSDSLTDSLANNETQAISESNQAAESALMGRRIAIVENLYDAEVITDSTIASAARESGYDSEQVDEWFGDGFPSRDEVLADTDLQNFMNTLSDGNVDMNEYAQNYELIFRDYFE